MSVRCRVIRVKSSRFREALDLARPAQAFGMPDYAQRSGFGLVIAEYYNPDFPGLVLETLPRICGHGGNGWLCRECADTMPVDEDRTA